MKRTHGATLIVPRAGIMLWLDKYQPKTLDELLTNPELTQLLRNFANAKNLPHLIFHGLGGGGKTTRATALLREIFGAPLVDCINAAQYGDLTFCKSQCHVQLNAGELGNKDTHVVQHLIKEQAAVGGGIAYAMNDKQRPPFRVFVILEADRLSLNAQAALRRTLESHARTCRVILICQQLSAIIGPVKSRCVAVPVALPQVSEVVQCLKRIVRQENLQQMTDEKLNSIAVQSGRNLRVAILMLEMAAMHGSMDVTSKQRPWLLQCEDIAERVVKQGNVQAVMECRNDVYEMLTALIPGKDILETLVKFLLQRVRTFEIQAQIVRMAAHYSHTMAIGNKEVMHLEAFLANCMNVVKKRK